MRGLTGNRCAPMQYSPSRTPLAPAWTQTPWTVTRLFSVLLFLPPCFSPSSASKWFQSIKATRTFWLLVPSWFFVLSVPLMLHVPFNCQLYAIRRACRNHSWKISPSCNVVLAHVTTCNDCPSGASSMPFVVHAWPAILTFSFCTLLSVHAFADNDCSQLSDQFHSLRMHDLYYHVHACCCSFLSA